MYLYKLDLCGSVFVDELLLCQTDAPLEHQHILEIKDNDLYFHDYRNGLFQGLSRQILKY